VNFLDDREPFLDAARRDRDPSIPELPPVTRAILS